MCHAYAHVPWPIMYVASVQARNARMRHAFVLGIIATFPAHQWTNSVLDGWCIRKFIMPLSSTESKSAVFSRNWLKPTAYKMLRTVTTLLFSHMTRKQRSDSIRTSVAYRSPTVSINHVPAHCPHRPHTVQEGMKTFWTQDTLDLRHFGTSVRTYRH